MSQSKLQNIKATLIPIAEQSNVKFLGLFGSRARGDEKKNSDIDILVKFVEPVTFIDLLALEGKMSKKLKCKVDLVTEKSLSPHIKKYLKKDIKVLYER